MGACETCKADFICGRLNAALNVVEAMPDLDLRPRLRRELLRVKGLLKQAGWNYPASPKACDFSGRVGEVHDLTEDLIEAVNDERARKVVWRLDRSLLAEEYRCE